LTRLRTNSTLSQKQNKFIDVFAMVLPQTSNRHVQAVMNNLKFIILDYLAAKIWDFDWHKDFWDWSTSSHSTWKVMPPDILPTATYSGIMLCTLNTDQ